MLSVISAGIIVCICSSFFEEKGLMETLIRMTGGLLLVFVMLSPLADWNFDLASSYSQLYLQPALDAVSRGSEQADQAQMEIIRRDTAAYILDKADELQAGIRVEVFLSSGDIPKPDSVRVSGEVTPYARKQLQRIIQRDLGIPKEKQAWIG